MDELLKFAPRPTGAGELLQLLRDGRPRTRAELATLTGQARPTIAARVDVLLATGLVAPAGEASSTGGRPPRMFAFNPAARVVLAVDLGATHVRMAVTDLVGTALAEHGEPVEVADGPDAVLNRVAEVGRQLLEEADRPVTDLAAVGVGLPGAVDRTSGRPTSPLIMPGWETADVPGWLGGVFDVPVVVDNDVNVMAVGEHAASWPDVGEMLFVKVATHIGAGVIADGRVRRGAQGAAGELGHIAVPHGPAVPCRCGNTGCLEAIASGAALVADLAGRGLPVRTAADVVALVRAGDLVATAAVRDAGRHIGGVLAGCVSLLNPSVVVVGGVVAEAGENLLAGIREVVYSHSLPLATEHLRIVTSRTQGRAGVLGASTMAAEHVLSPAAVDARVNEVVKEDV